MTDWFQSPEIRRIATTCVAVVAVHLSLTMTFKLSRRFLRKPSSGTVEYHPDFKGLSIWASIVTLLGFYFLVRHTAPHEIALAIGCVTGFTLMSAALVLETFRVKVLYDDEAIYTRSPWRRNRIIRWENLGTVTYSKGARWWRIETRNQGVIRLHDYFVGVDSLLETVSSKARPTSRKPSLDPETGSIL